MAIPITGLKSAFSLPPSLDLLVSNFFTYSIDIRTSIAFIPTKGTITPPTP